MDAPNPDALTPDALDLPEPPARHDASVEQAQTWCADLLAQPEWEPVADRVTALITSPPALPEAALDDPPLVSHTLGAWFVVDARARQHLGSDWREAIAVRGARVERQLAAGGLHARLTVITEEALAQRLESVARHGLETRWLMQHAHPAHDPMHRHQQMVGAARTLPEGGLERACRTQYLAATAAFRSLLTGGVTAVTLGEATAAVGRLACIIDWGCHPPAEWLEARALRTALGGRLRSWLEDVPAALSGDDRARRWVIDAGSGVLREAEAALRIEYGASDWLQDPDSFAVRHSR